MSHICRNKQLYDMDQQTPILKTRFRIEKERKDKEIYDKFQELIAIPGAQILEVNKEIERLFPEIHSQATIWNIRKRVAARLELDKKTEESNN